MKKQKLKRYVSKFSSESISDALGWGICNTLKQAISQGHDGIEGGLGGQFRIVEITFKEMSKVYKRKTKP